MNEHEELRLLLGGYLLGGLAAADRSRLDAHLAGCAACRDQLAELAPLPGLLGRASARSTPDPVPPARDLTVALRASIRAERADRRRRSRVRLVGVAMAAALVGIGLASLAFVGVPFSGSSSTPAAAPTEGVAGVVALAPGDSGSARGELILVTRAWGTEVELVASDLPVEPAAGPFRLHVVGADGVEELAATWGPTPAGKARVRGATSLSPDRIRAVRVVGADGAVLVGEALVRTAPAGS